MSFTFNNENPIYLQIVELITSQITSKELLPGQKLLSVREYAAFFHVNPNTICKALDILEQDKLITTESTNGKFVTTDISIINKYKDNLFNKKINLFLESMEKMGYSKEEVISKMMEENK